MATSAPADLGQPRGDNRELHGAAGHAAKGSGASNRSSPLRTTLRLILFGLLLVGFGYGGGRLDAWRRANAEQRQRESQLLAQQADEQRAKEQRQQTLLHAQALTDRALRERDQLAVVAGLYEGYRRVQHALNALDARNFGIAEARVRDAERQLAPLASEVAGLAAILEQLAGTSVAVAGNLGDQRRAVAAIASSLDGALTEQRTAANIEELQAATRKDDGPRPTSAAAAAAAPDPEPRSAPPSPQTAPEPLVPAREAPPAAPAGDTPRVDEGGPSAR